MHLRLKVCAICIAVHKNILQLPDSLKESAAPLHAVLTPCCGEIERTDEHLIGTKRICAVILHDIVRVHHVAAGLGHLLTVRTKDHAVARSLLVRFGSGNHALIIKEPVPETGIQKVQGRVLHTTVIPVNREPIFQSFLACKRFRVGRIGITQEIPGRTSPLRHGVGLSLCGSAAARTGRVDPIRHGSQRGLSVIRRHVAFHLGELQRKLGLIQGNEAALLTLYDGNGLTPVSLAGEHPVTQLIIGLAGANALFL